MSEKWEDGNYVLYPAINHEQSLTDELLKSRQSPETLLARIAELEAAQRWKPVSEKPLEAGRFLVLLEDGSIKIDWTFIDGGRYYWWNSGGQVTHWMSLPPNPESQN